MFHIYSASKNTRHQNRTEVTDYVLLLPLTFWLHIVIHDESTFGS